MEGGFEKDSGGKRLVSSGPQSLQIAKNEEASVTIAGPFHEVRPSSPAGFTSRQCLRIVEMREIGKEPQLAGVKRCRETFHEETPRVTGMTSRLRPLARTRRFSVAAAIDKAICGTKADPVPQ